MAANQHLSAAHIWGHSRRNVFCACGLIYVWMVQWGVGGGHRLLTTYVGREKPLVLWSCRVSSV
jgi:hypothetical protein